MTKYSKKKCHLPSVFLYDILLNILLLVKSCFYQISLIIGVYMSLVSRKKLSRIIFCQSLGVLITFCGVACWVLFIASLLILNGKHNLNSNLFVSLEIGNVLTTINRSQVRRVLIRMEN